MQTFQQGVKSAVVTANTLSLSVTITLADIYWALTTYLFVCLFICSFVCLFKVGLIEV